MTQLPQQPRAPAGNLAGGVHGAGVAGSGGKCHRVGKPGHRHGQVAAEHLTLPELPLAARSPARHGPVAVQCTDVESLMRVIAAGDAHDIPQACGAFQRLQRFQLTTLPMSPLVAGLKSVPIV